MGGQDTQTAIEICDIADFTWSLGYLLQATGEVRWADMIERACLNAGTGAATGDFTGHQYYTAPNQALATNNCAYSHQERGSNRMQYRPNPNTECCSGNVHRIMPNYVARMWMQRDADTLVSVLYGPSVFEGEVAGKAVTIHQETTFPFEETVRYKIDCSESKEWTLSLRIPGWTEGATIRVNGERLDADCSAGTFFDLRRVFADGDVIELTLPMKTKMTRWPQGGVALERGPLVYSLDIATETIEEKLDNKSCVGLPPLTMLPTSTWNYGMDLDEISAGELTVEQVNAVGENPLVARERAAGDAGAGPGDRALAVRRRGVYCGWL